MDAAKSLTLRYVVQDRTTEVTEQDPQTGLKLHTLLYGTVLKVQYKSALRNDLRGDSAVSERFWTYGYVFGGRSLQ